jgi:hypothetical protein
LAKEREESKMKPRFRAEGHGRIGGVDGRESEGFDIFCKLDIW